MDFNYNLYAILLLIFGSITISLAFFIIRKGGNAVKWFSLMMLSNGLWSIAYGFELASSTLPQILQIINIEYLGIAGLPLFWFLFCLNFSDKECWYHKPFNLFILLLGPLATLLLVWTNPYHHLYYTSYKINTEGPFPLFEFTPGLFYVFFIIYFYLLLASGCYLIFIKFGTSDPIFKKQNYSLIIAAAIPWLANVLYLLGIRPFGHLDLTPFAFIITSLLIFFGIYRYKLFDIIPIAREKVLELMQDGFIVLDNEYRVIDYNKAIHKFIAPEDQKKLIGSTIHQLFPRQQSFLQMIAKHVSGTIEFENEQAGNRQYLQADIIFLNESKINHNFSIIKLQDLTIYKREAILNKTQAGELQKLNQLKDRIFSIIAHDLRGPLVNLSEVLKMTSSGQISNEEFKDLSPTLNKDIIYTTDLLENILHWSRSQLRGYGLKKEYFNLRNLIINEIDYHLPAAYLKKINIIHDVFPNEMVYADILMVQITIRNIINNAIKFCLEDCEINITARYDKNNRMLICIADNGVGIPQKTLKRLFKEENVSTRGTSNEKGTGLGLMICKDFIQRNEGQIWVESKQGEGASFYITLPIAPPHGEQVNSRPQG